MSKVWFQLDLVPVKRKEIHKKLAKRKKSSGGVCMRNSSWGGVEGRKHLGRQMCPWLHLGPEKMRAGGGRESRVDGPMQAAPLRRQQPRGHSPPPPTMFLGSGLGDQRPAGDSLRVPRVLPGWSFTAQLIIRSEQSPLWQEGESCLSSRSPPWLLSLVPFTSRILGGIPSVTHLQPPCSAAASFHPSLGGPAASRVLLPKDPFEGTPGNLPSAETFWKLPTGRTETAWVARPSRPL